MANGWKYCSIVFCQGDEATEPLKILDEKGPKATVEYLSQWDYGTDNEHPLAVSKEAPWGTSDSVEKVKGTGYTLTYNLRLGYIGLIRMVRQGG